MTTTLLYPHSPFPYPTPTIRFLARAWWTCYSSPPHTWRRRSDVVLATGQPFSVILPNIRAKLDLEIISTPGWKGFSLTWLGIPCLVGRVTMWLPSQETPGHMRSFSLVTLFPKQDIPHAPPFIQLGAQFLLEYNVQAILNDPATGGNRLVIP